ncbi:hypothetical protein BDW69DRAFT_177063 [Aspergillus filifer]
MASLSPLCIWGYPSTQSALTCTDCLSTTSSFLRFFFTRELPVSKLSLHLTLELALKGVNASYYRHAFCSLEGSRLRLRAASHHRLPCRSI